MTHEFFKSNSITFKRSDIKTADIFGEETMAAIQKQIMKEAEEKLMEANLSSYEHINVPVSADHGLNMAFKDKDGKEYKGNIWITHFDREKTYGFAIVKREKVFN